MDRRVTFLVVLDIGLVLPALPQFARHYDLTSADVALLLAAFAGGRLAFSLPGGVLADRFGFKPVAIVGCCVAGIAASFAATLPSFLPLVATQFAQGLGSALYTTAALAAVMADAPGERTGRIVALYQGVVIAGMTAAPALGGVALQTMGLRGPFVVYALSVIVGLIIAILGSLVGSSVAETTAGAPDSPDWQDVAASCSDPCLGCVVPHLLGAGRHPQHRGAPVR